MTVTVVEYGGFESGRPFAPGFPMEPPLAVTQYSSNATSTGFLLPGTRLVFVDDSFQTSPSAWILFTGSTGSTTVATSTNGVPIPVTGIYRYVPQCFSTVTGAPSTSGVRYTILSS